MRICVDGTSIKPGASAGVEAFAYGLVRGMAEVTDNDIKVDILAGTADAWRRQITDDRVELLEVSMALRSDSLIGRGARRYLPSQMRSSRIARQLVNAVRGTARPAAGSGRDINLYPFSCVPVRAEKSVFVLHDLRRLQAGFREKGYEDIIRQNVAQADAVAVSWPHPYRQALEFFPEARDKIAMIPLPAFHSRPPGLQTMPEDGLLLYPSSTAAHKNHATLLQGMTMLPGSRLICPGPLVEPEASRLLHRAAKKDLAGRVSFPGFVSEAELAALYRRAWAVVVPSTWEAASGAIFEAFSWGLPVACADVEPLRAQVEFAGADVAFFQPYDPRSLASAVRRLATEREHFAAASRAANRRLAGRTWADTARDYLAVFDWVTAGRPGPIPQSNFDAPVEHRKL